MRRFGRLTTNLGVIVLLTLVLTAYALVNWVGSAFFQDRYEIIVPAERSGGLFPNQEVTVLGHGVGAIKDLTLTDKGVNIILDIRGENVVPRHAIAHIMRRSAVGEQALNFVPVDPSFEPESDGRLDPTAVPVAENWQAAERGAVVDPVALVYPPEIQPLLDNAVQLFEAIDSQDLGTVVNELGDALGGRGDLLVDLNRKSFDLNETLVSGIPEFRRLIDTSEPVLATLVEHREDLAGLFPPLADLSDELASERDTLEELLETGRTTLTQGEAFVLNTRANQHCLMHDFRDINETLARPGNLDNISKTLAWHNYFFQDGFDVITQFDPYRNNVAWQRINLLIFEEAAGQPYEPHRPTPATLPGAACQSPWGVGVNAVRQADHQPPDETAPPIDFAPLVRGGTSSQVSAAPAGEDDGDPRGSAFGDEPDGVTPETGGGLAAIGGVLAILAVAGLRRRR